MDDGEEMIDKLIISTVLFKIDPRAALLTIMQWLDGATTGVIVLERKGAIDFAEEAKNEL